MYEPFTQANEVKMGNPVVVLCGKAGEQNSFFDMLVTDVTDKARMVALRTQVLAAGFRWLGVDRNSSDTCVVSLGCQLGEVFEDKHFDSATRAVTAAGMDIAA